MKKTTVGLAFAALTGSALAAESFTIDPNHTWPYFAINHLGFSTQHGRFNKTSGKITLDRSARKGSVEVTIDSGSIDMGLDKWDAHMKDEDFFNVAAYPTMTFKSDKFVFDGDKPVAAEGTLTLLGVTKPVRLEIRKFNCGANPITKKPLCAADLGAVIKRSEWGMTKYVPAVSDLVQLTIPIEAYKD
ncbi:MAG: polyisoprenoid-binding protein [Sterolibacteriaceae bacterium]|nr:polyisoprenoid-binding protein [Sterolibacteriaceae bacterium]